MTTYALLPGELVECGLERGYGSTDFGLERVSVGGELASEDSRGAPGGSSGTCGSTRTTG